MQVLLLLHLQFLQIKPVFTNKTFDANGTGNSITNIEVADLASGVLDTDLTSTAATDTTIPSAKAVKTIVDTKASIGLVIALGG
jgi:hypothetical protein